MPGGALTHKSKTHRLEYLEQVAKMDRRGYSGTQIALELGVSQSLVSEDLKKIRKDYIESMRHVKEELIAGKIAQFEEIRREAWAAYERSKQDTHKEVQEFATHNEDDGGGTIDSSELRIKRIVTREGRLPLNQYLQTVLETLAAERELLGLDEAKKVDVSANVVHWDAFFQLPDTAQSQPSNVIGAEVIEAVILPAIEASQVQPESTPDAMHPSSTDLSPETNQEPHQDHPNGTNGHIVN